MIETVPAHGGTAVSSVDELLHAGLKHGASDIHIEPHEHHLAVRFRIDGILHKQPKIPAAYGQQLITRLKVLGNLDITEKRIPQDGKLRYNHEGTFIDVRVATFPTLYGEKVVLRILDKKNKEFALNQLGLSATILQDFSVMLKKPNGFFIVAGPTGSGKTTTLYAALNQLNTLERNVVTLEDPIEYNIDSITQAQINPDIGFNFEKGMRALLRQDPDIIMIGEIRDRQTAQTALEAALTGHLVLSTIHTYDAPSVIMRLMDMGVEPYLINAALSGILCQRLARLLCAACKEEIKPTSHDQSLFEYVGVSFDSIFVAKGCKQCNFVGYKGRTGIFQWLSINAIIRDTITHCPSHAMIEKKAQEFGFTSLQQAALEKVKQGLITLQEMVRILA